MEESIRAGKTAGPPMTARAMAIIHTAAYDAWAPYHGTAVATQAGGVARITGRSNTEQTKSIAVSYAMYRAMLD